MKSSPHVSKPHLATLAGCVLFGALASHASGQIPQITNPPNTPLNRSGFTLTFSDEFTGALSLADGSGNTWIGGNGWNWYGHLPFPATLVSGGVGETTPANAYTQNGELVMKVSINGSLWDYPVLSSQFAGGGGFAQQYGYFEARMRLPSGNGAWPAFWLTGSGLNYYSTPTRVTAEIDILESYGIDPGLAHQNYHQWTPQGGGWYDGVTPPETTFRLDDPSAYHTYGLLVQPDFITWYIDDQAIRSMPTPDAAKEPLSVVLNFAVDGGYGTAGLPDPSFTYVDYVHVYSTPEPSSVGLLGLGGLIFLRRWRGTASSLANG